MPPSLAAVEDDGLFAAFAVAIFGTAEAKRMYGYE